MTIEKQSDQLLNQIEPMKIALFSTCLVNNFRPAIGFASVRLLKAIGYDPEVPLEQTCCGQPNYNNGDSQSAIRVAKSNIQLLEGFDAVVAPSASCAGMIRNHYPSLLQHDAHWHRQAIQLADKTWELSEFIWEKNRNNLPINRDLSFSLTHHYSCSTLREIKTTQQIDGLVKHQLPNCKIEELSEPEACCGFGGSFCLKFNDISNHMGQNKLQDIEQSCAQVATSLDFGCIMHLQSLINENSKTKIQHFAEFLDEALLEHTEQGV